jgi:hypothetical protein
MTLPRERNLQPPSQRLTDEEWQARISAGKAPTRPDWTRLFQAPASRRDLGPIQRTGKMDKDELSRSP